jgi:hypothetical protein
MPRDQRAAWRLLAPFQNSAALVDEGFAIERDVQENISVDENLRRL